MLAFSLVGLNVFIYGLLYDILQKEVRTREYMVSMAKAEGKIQLYQKQTAFIRELPESDAVCQNIADEKKLQGGRAVFGADV